MLKQLEDLFSNPLFEISKDCPQGLQFKEGDIREVAILYADLAGFTALSEKINHEEAQVLLDKVLSAFTTCIQRFGGEVSRYAGDQVMALFGAKVAKENDLERAIRAGMDIILTLDQINALLNDSGITTKLGGKLCVRVGINYGEVATGKVGAQTDMAFTVYGESVNLAARMESNAPIGRIMLPKKTAQKVAGRFDFEDYAEIELKGVSEKVSCVLLKGPKNLPSINHQRTHFLGRQNEWKMFEEIYVKAQHAPQWIYLQGPAGMGKSRLLHEFLKAKLAGRTESNLSLKGQCCELDGFSFSPFRSLFEHCDLKQTEITLPDLNKIDQDIILRFLRSAAQRAAGLGTPLIFILEDIHWSDNQTTQLLHSLFQSIQSGKWDSNILVILTSRNQETPFNADFTHCIKLQPLELEDVASLVGKNKAAHYLNRSGGNPLYLEELKELKLDDKKLPSNIKSILMSRIDQLSRNDKLLLQIVSVLGEPFSLDLCQSLMTKIKHMPYHLNATGPLAEFLISQKHNIFGLKHDLIRETVYHSLLDQNRIPMHRLIAQELEQTMAKDHPNYTFLLGHHYFAGGDAAKALPFLIASGRWANRTQNFKRSCDIFGKIISVEEQLKLDTDTRVLARILLADAVAVIADNKDALRLYQEAFRLDNNAGGINTARLLNRYGELTYFMGRGEKSKDLIANSLKIFTKINDLDGIAWCHLNLAKVTYYSGKLNDSEFHIAQALKTQRPDKPNITFTCYDLSALIFVNRAELDQANACQEKMRLAMESRPTLHFYARFCNLESKILLISGRLNQAIKKAEMACAYAEQIGEKALICECMTTYAETLWHIDPSSSLATLLNVFERCQVDGLVWNEALAHSCAGTTYRLLGEFSRAEEQYLKAIEMFSLFNASFLIFATRLAYCDLLHDNFERKQDALEQLSILSQQVENIDGEIFKKKLLLKFAKFHLSYYEFDKALPYYTKIVFSKSHTLVPYIDYAARYFYTRCLLKLGRSDEAIEYFSKLPIQEMQHTSGRTLDIGLQVQYLLAAYLKNNGDEFMHKKTLLENKISNIKGPIQKFEFCAVLAEGLLIYGETKQARAMIQELLRQHPLNTPFSGPRLHARCERVKKYLLSL